MYTHPLTCFALSENPLSFFTFSTYKTKRFLLLFLKLSRMVIVIFPGGGEGKGDDSSSEDSSESTTTEPDHGSFVAGDIGFVLICSALVFWMIPGLSLFYAGMVRAKSALNLIFICFWSLAIVSIQWFLFGYSLTFSRNANFIIGNFDNAFLIGVYDQPSIGNDKIPDIVFCIYQGMFAGITPALALGAGAGRGRFFPTAFFIFLWTSLVYDFIACWTWNPNGWSNKMGGLDFAGGSPVHISSGAAALVYALILGPRDKAHSEIRPHNLTYTLLGTGILWFGWFGFNGGSALAPTIQAAMACFVTNLAASIGGVVWVILDFIYERHWSPLGFCSGAVAGLVSITPGCGYVGPWQSLVIGASGGFICFIAVRAMHATRLDDAVDVFAVHGVGGILGCILTGVFAQKYYAPEIEGGCIDGNCIQIIHQLVDSAAAFSWSFVVTFIILGIMNFVPGFKLRIKPINDKNGVDISESGISAYEFHEEFKNQIMNEIQFGNLWCRTNESPPIIIQKETTTKYRNNNNDSRKLDYSFQSEHFNNHQSHHHQPPN